MHGIKITGGITEHDLLGVLKNKLHDKLKGYITSLDSFVLKQPYILLNNTTLELIPE